MILTLLKADFSVKNIGTLNSFAIITALGFGATYNGPRTVAKDSFYTAEIILNTGYGLTSAGISVTMGGVAIDAVSINDKVITLTINKVTGPIKIVMPTKNEITGEINNTPTETIWYVNSASLDLPTECVVSNNSYGWCYSNATEQEAIRNKYINAIRFCTSSTSGTVTIGVVDAVNSTSVYNVQTATFSKDNNSKELVTVVFDIPFVLTDNQILIFEPASHSQRAYNHYFGAAGDGVKEFYSRIPVDLSGSSGAWRKNTGNSIGISVGYYVAGTEEALPENNTPSIDTDNIAWYGNNASDSLTMTCANDSNGWTYASETEHDAYRNKPVNYCRFATKATSGTVKLGVATSKGSTEFTDFATGTFTKSDSNVEVVKVKLDKTITVGNGEYLIIEPYIEAADAFSSKSGKYSFQYGTVSGGTGFLSRIPSDLEKNGANPWKVNSGYTIGWDFGYEAE